MIKAITEQQMIGYQQGEDQPLKGLFLAKQKNGGFLCLKNLMGVDPEYKRWQFLQPAKAWLNN